MYPHATNITELVASLRLIDSLSYRFMAEQVDGKLRVTRLIIGPHVSWKRYEYGDVVFISGIEQGKTIAD